MHDDLKIKAMELPGMDADNAVDAYTREQSDKRYQKKLTEKQLENIDSVSHKAGYKTENGGEIFNDYDNNISRNEFTTSMGKNTQAGMKAFRILQVMDYKEFRDEDGKLIDDMKNVLLLDSVEGLEIGAVCSLILGKCYNDYAEIVKIQDNYVSIDTPIEGTLVCDEAVIEQPWENTLSINEKPDIGTIGVGFGALATGIDTIALRVGSHSSGYKTVALWIGSDAGGIKTWAGFAAFARGAYTKAIGNFSYAGGYGCKVYVDYGFAHGLHLLSSKTQLQALFGQYNIVDDEALFIIGNGTGEDNEYRSNALVVKKDGRLVLGASPQGDMDATNKGYVINQIKSSQENVSNAVRTTKTGTALVEVNDLVPFTHPVEIALSPNMEKSDNLVTLPYTDGTSKTDNGITFTVDEDGSITATGTATGYATFIIKRGFNIIENGIYRMSGFPSKLSSAENPIYMYLRNNSTEEQYLVLRNTDSVIEQFVATETTEDTRVQITIFPGVKLDNVVFKPKICAITEPFIHINDNYAKRIVPDAHLNTINITSTYPTLKVTARDNVDLDVTYNQDVNTTLKNIKAGIKALDTVINKRFPVEPQINITTEELVRYIDVDEIDGVPLADYNFTCAKVLFANNPQTESKVTEFQAKVNDTLAYTSAPTGFLYNSSQQYWGAYFDLKCGLILGQQLAVANPLYRTNVTMAAGSEQIISLETITSFRFKSVLQDIPVGTNIKVWLK